MSQLYLIGVVIYKPVFDVPNARGLFTKMEVENRYKYILSWWSKKSSLEILSHISTL